MVPCIPIQFSHFITVRKLFPKNVLPRKCTLQRIPCFHLFIVMHWFIYFDTTKCIIIKEKWRVLKESPWSQISSFLLFIHYKVKMLEIEKKRKISFILVYVPNNFAHNKNMLLNDLCYRAFLFISPVYSLNVKEWISTLLTS